MMIRRLVVSVTVLGLVALMPGCKGKRDSSGGDQGSGGLKIGERVRFWQVDDDEKDATQFAITFERVSVESRSFLRPEVAAWRESDSVGSAASPGRKYLRIVMKVENLGPRPYRYPQVLMEARLDKGTIYPIVEGGSGDLAARELFKAAWPDELRRGRYFGGRYDDQLHVIEPGQTGWFRIETEIPDGTRPVELSGSLGGHWGKPGKRKFLLKVN